MSILINLKEGKNLGIEVTSGPIVSSVSLLGGAVYAGTGESADLLEHLRGYDAASDAAGNDPTFNINGTNRDAKFTNYTGPISFGSGTLPAATSKLSCARIDGDLTISSGFTLYPSTDCYGMYIYVDGNLTVDGTISTYQYGESRTSAAGALSINGNVNETAGSTIIAFDGSAGSHTNGSSTASAIQTGGGGQGQYGSYGRGNGAIGHSFAGGSGGGGGGGIAYPGHYQGGGGGGGGATTYSRNGGNGGASGYTKWGYWTADAGGTGGNGNPAGGGGANNSRNGSDSRAGYGGHSSSVSSSLVVYATGDITINSGGVIETKGRGGQTGGTSRLSAGGGGGTGGGALVAICGGTFTNNGTVSTNGGSTGSGRGSGSSAGNGGLLTGGGYA
tara:strand:+ start:12155 stop:13321 length:1167 start_codon:yes stop_codon:yes gene_type:complete